MTWVQIPTSTPYILCGLSLLLVLSSAARRFSLSTLTFPSPQKPMFNLQTPIQPGMAVEEPQCGCATSKLFFLYLFNSITLHNDDVLWWLLICDIWHSLSVRSLHWVVNLCQTALMLHCIVFREGNTSILSLINDTVLVWLLIHAAQVLSFRQ